MLLLHTVGLCLRRDSWLVLEASVVLWLWLGFVESASDRFVTTISSSVAWLPTVVANI